MPKAGRTTLNWTVVLEPSGTPAEGAEAVRQARRQIAEWIARRRAEGAYKEETGA
jgi:hypothetical protein